MKAHGDANIALARAERDLYKTSAERLGLLKKVVQFLTTCEAIEEIQDVF